DRDSKVRGGASTINSSQLMANMPMPIKISRGIDLVMVRNTAIFAPSFTPITLTQVRMPNEPETTNALPQPTVAAGHRYPIARAKPAEREATEVTRANQVIQPTSKPTNSPKASLVYR